MSAGERPSQKAARNLKIASWLFSVAAVAFGGAAAMGTGLMAIVAAVLCAIAAIMYFRKLKQLGPAIEPTDSA